MYSRATTSSMALRPVLPAGLFVFVLVDMLAVMSSEGRTLGGAIVSSSLRNAKPSQKFEVELAVQRATLKLLARALPRSRTPETSASQQRSKQVTTRRKSPTSPLFALHTPTLTYILPHAVV